jgi:endonuclease YncB( thermonuclease family)
MTRYTIFASALLFASPATGQMLVSGEGKAADGDTLMVGVDRVRLFGIDAPELHQTCERGGQKWSCGEEAKTRLAGMVDRREVVCATTGADDFGRLLARCKAGGIDLNQRMVEAGFAVAFRRYSSDYVASEANAKLARRGVWSGTFQMPSEYRQALRGGSREQLGSPPLRSSPQPARQRQASSARGSCDIKGNRNRRGQWIYHVPGMPYYSQTRAEQMFCSEADAQAAGYRRAIVR